MTGLYITLGIFGIIALIALLVAIGFLIRFLLKMDKFFKESKKLVKNVNKKIEGLDQILKNMNRLANYFDIFEVIAKKNVKSAAKLFARNKEVVNNLIDKVKTFANK